MLRCFSPAHVIARAIATLGLAVVAGCGEAPVEVTVVLSRAEGATFDRPGALKVIVRDTSVDEPEIFGPFAVEREESSRLAAEVAPGSDFYVDVWACPAVDACGPTDVLGRGCTSVVRVPAGAQSAAVDIPIHDADVGNDRCPPEIE